jgi:hypothetical protein
MSLAEISCNSMPAPEPCDVRVMVFAVETLLVDELRQERDSLTDVGAEIGTDALDYFTEWCDGYGLPPTAHMLAAYLYELHHEHGAPFAELEEIARAFLFEHTMGVRVPVFAVLRHCASTASHSLEARH